MAAYQQRLQRLICRPLRSRFERGRDGERAPQGDQDEAQQNPQPGEDEAQVVTDGGKDDVSGVAVTTLEITTAEVSVSLHVADDRFDG
jgi:hypothetical protein